MEDLLIGIIYESLLTDLFENINFEEIEPLKIFKYCDLESNKHVKLKTRDETYIISVQKMI